MREHYANQDPVEVFGRYLDATSGLVIFTFGDAPVWFSRPGEEIRYAQPISIEPVDTTGGGDSFRAGIVYEFLQEWADERKVAFAAAVAAINCTQFPGVLNSPTLGEVTDLLKSTGG